MAANTLIPREITDTVHEGVAYFRQQLDPAVGTQPPDVAAAITSCTVPLQNGGKRWRGALAVIGFQIYGGTDMEAIGQVAGALEALQTGILIWDDIHDDSATRRGMPAAHVRMRDHLTARGFPEHAVKKGRDTAQIAASILMDQARDTILGVNLPPRRVLAAGRILSQGLVQTGLGQLRDITPVSLENLNADEILKTYELKTGIYTFAMPLQIGATLAGARMGAMRHFERYAIPAGKAFQLKDDILGLFGNEEVTGKPLRDDIVESKPTWLVARALERATRPQRERLLHWLGNTAVTHEGINECREVIRDTGTFTAAQALIDQFTNEATKALAAAPARWGWEQVELLQNVVRYNRVREK